jgi:hypothetical protein
MVGTFLAHHQHAIQVIQIGKGPVKPLLKSNVLENVEAGRQTDRKPHQIKEGEAGSAGEISPGDF